MRYLLNVLWGKTLYTPPVVVSDDGAIQVIGPMNLWFVVEVHRYFFNRGSKSRNKVAVGEPAAGSFTDLNKNKKNNNQGNVLGYEGPQNRQERDNSLLGSLRTFLKSSYAVGRLK